MNYYKRHLGDYAKDTKHLTLAEHGAFTVLLDYYYATERPIPDDRCERIAGARTDDEVKAVRSVLADFFTLVDGAWHNNKCESVIGDSVGKSSKARESAAFKWCDTAVAAATRAQRMSAARAIATHTPSEWNALVNACGNACVRCGAAGISAGIVKDHITPIYQGGSDGIENLQPLCKRCNSSKGPENKDLRPADWEDRLRKCLRNASEMPASHKPLAIKKKEQKTAPEGDLLNGIAPQVASDFRALRTKLRAPITATAVAGIRREADKAGISMEAALTACCERGWRGFKAEWVAPQQSAANVVAIQPGGGRRAL